DLSHSVAARTQAPARAGDESRPHHRGSGARAPEGAAETDASCRADAPASQAAEASEAACGAQGRARGRHGRVGGHKARSIGGGCARPCGALRVGDRLLHQTKDLVLGRDAAEALERARAPERLAEIGAGGRAGPEVVAAPG